LAPLKRNTLERRRDRGFAVTLRNDEPDRREWVLGNYEVNYIHLDYRFGFDLLGSSGHASIVIEVPFSVQGPSGTSTHDPAAVSDICGALQILHKQAERLTAFRDGTLEVAFQDGILLRVAKHAQYESWEAHGDGELEELAFLCTPQEGPPWRE
jgi:hypothetical protein